MLSSVITVVDYWCFNNEFYSREYNLLNTAEEIGMSNDDLSKTTDVLLNYLKDKDLTLDLKVKVKGELREVFNQREKMHMVDVRDLYQNAILVRNIFLGIFVFTLILLIIKKDLSYLFISYKKSLLIFLIIFGIIGVFCLIDFDTFWTNFHYIFFPGNDLWLLDPRTDILIMMVPSKFFFDLCVVIVFSIFVILTIMYFVLKILDKRFFNRA